MSHRQALWSGIPCETQMLASHNVSCRDLGGLRSSSRHEGWPQQGVVIPVHKFSGLVLLCSTSEIWISFADSPYNRSAKCESDTESGAIGYAPWPSPLSRWLLPLLCEAQGENGASADLTRR